MVKLRHLDRSAIALAMVASSFPAFAQEATTAAAASAAETAAPSSGVPSGEIIVTALKRETRLESTPVAISVLSGASLEARGITEIRNLRAEVPSLTLSESPGGLTGISIRGVGTSASSQAFEQSVGLFLDGIYRPRARQYRDALFDVAQVEVIKGAQGVLFGKNTSVGAISIRTRNPGSTFGGELSGSYETEFHSKLVQGGVDIPLGDHAALRLAGLWEDEGGFVRNVVKDRSEPDTKRLTGRATLRLEPTADLTVTMKAQAGRLRTRGDAFDFVSSDAPLVLQFLGVADGGQTPFEKYDSSSPIGDSFDHQHSFDASVAIDWKIGDLTLTSLTGYSGFRYSNGFDSDSTPVPIAYQRFDEKFHQVTQELRLATNGTGPLQLTGGLFYLNQHDRFDTRVSLLHLVLPALPGVDFTGDRIQNFRQTENTYSAFSQATLTLAAGFKATAGARYSHDRKVGEYEHTNDAVAGIPASPFFPLFSPPGAAALTARDNSFDFSGTLSYDLTERAVAYVSVGRGTKSGGFNNNALSFLPTPTPFFLRPEQATTYEAGVKGRFLDGKAYVALAAFMIDIKAFQDAYFDSIRNGYVVRSLGAKTRGVEGEFRVNPVGWLTVFGNAAYLPTAKLATNERMQRAPKFTSLLGAQISAPLSGDLAMNLSGQWNHASNSLNQAPSAPGSNGTGMYSLFDARLSLKSAGAGLELFVAGSNLSNKHYPDFSFGSILGLGTIGTLNRPRTIMIGARKTF